MTSERKRALPVVDPATPLPTLDAARRKLGGRAESGPAPTGTSVGALVRVAGASGGAPGVLLFASGSECDVLFASGVVRRARPDAVSPHAGEVPRALQRLADDARVFAQLREGERVRYEPRTGEVAEATVREKCRWGALVATGDGKTVAVGFRKLWPVAKGDVPS